MQCSICPPKGWLLGSSPEWLPCWSSLVIVAARTIRPRNLIERDEPMADVTIEVPRTDFRQLRLPTMGQEFERLAGDAAATNQTFVQFCSA